MGKRKDRKPKAANSNEPVVNPFAAQHGDYRETKIVDLSGELGGGRNKIVSALKNRDVVDRWLDEGGPGFDEPQRRAVERCRALWRLAGNEGRLVANLDWIGGGGGGRERGLEQAEALAALAGYRDRLTGVQYAWDTFENMVRFGAAANEAGQSMANNKVQRIAHAKACVGFVASKIAEWERL